MKRIRFALLSALACALLAPLVRAQSISINATVSGEIAPGVYGQVMLGSAAPPPVVYAQPIIVQPVPVIVGAAPVEPIYLHVPPGHAKHWKEHCHEYHACNRPVYFVKSAEYEPGYRPDKEHGHEHGHHDDEHGHRDD
jgi:hypothetical protein